MLTSLSLLYPAIGFSYFEKLIEVGDQSQVGEEVARLLSLRPLLENTQGSNYSDEFAEEVIGLLRGIAGNLPDNKAAAFDKLHEVFDDPVVSGYILFYFRLLAAAHLKTNAESYDPFTADTNGVHGYCSQSIEVIDREIEELGIIALTNILLKPVGFVLEIAYLDRSPGSDVNRYRFPDEANNQDISSLGPIIYLLYRPTHYDILYREPNPYGSDGNGGAQSASLQVNRVSHLAYHTNFVNTQPDLGSYSTNYDSLSMAIPGLTTAMASSLSPLASSAHESPTMDSFSHPSNPYWMSGYTTKLESPSILSANLQDQSPPAGMHHVSTSPSPLSAHASAGSGGSSPPAIPTGTNTSAFGSVNIRFSPHQLDYNKGNFLEQTFQVTTNTFKNSVWNRAHYGNPDFHPEEWSPEDDRVDQRVSNRRRHQKDS